MGMRLSLSWGAKPLDLDLQVYRRTHNDWDDSCRTSYQQKTGCRYAVLDLDNTKGGEKGSETIPLNSIPEQADNVYMVFVNNFVTSKSEEFKNSQAHIGITDGIMSHSIDMKITAEMKSTGLLVASDSEMVPMNLCLSTPSSMIDQMKRSLTCVLKTLVTVLLPQRDHGIDSGDKHFH